MWIRILPLLFLPPQSWSNTFHYTSQAEATRIPRDLIYQSLLEFWGLKCFFYFVKHLRDRANFLSTESVSVYCRRPNPDASEDWKLRALQFRAPHSVLADNLLHSSDHLQWACVATWLWRWGRSIKSPRLKVGINDVDVLRQLTVDACRKFRTW